MRGALELVGDRGDRRLVGEAVVVVVVEGAGHPERARDQRSQAREELLVVLEHGSVAGLPRVEREALIGGGERGFGLLLHRTQQPCLDQQGVPLSGRRPGREGMREPVERRRDLCSEGEDRGARRVGQYRRDDDDVDDHADRGAEDRFDDAGERVLQVRRAEREHEHDTDRDLVRRARGEFERPGEKEGGDQGEEDDPGVAAERQPDHVGDHHAEDHADRAFDRAAHRLVDARLNDEERGDRREHRELPWEDQRRDAP
jgi:hypothetical protein